jgi:hypothetical protein
MWQENGDIFRVSPILQMTTHQEEFLHHLRLRNTDDF